MKLAKPDMSLLHPLPRVNEIKPEVDGLPNAWYFKQVHHGVYARMAIIGLALGLI
jgi:aspartate carbamoyltransferase catalytic subunit